MIIIGCDYHPSFQQIAQGKNFLLTFPFIEPALQ
jgi:hypothetical protein